MMIPRKGSPSPEQGMWKIRYGVCLQLPTLVSSPQTNSRKPQRVKQSHVQLAGFDLSDWRRAFSPRRRG
ncbi:unnamed protein product [Boreogadus saida]